jgi:hypothetical protein
MQTNGHRLYLRLGDKVSHQRYGQWGEGTVVEEMTSTIPGGTCLVRIVFGDGRERVFHNDLDNEMCCYYFGIRQLWSMDLETVGTRRAPRTARPRRLRLRSA